jgi:hypothetical protein
MSAVPYEVEVKRRAVLEALWAVATASRVLQGNVGRTTGPMWSALDRALASLDAVTSATTEQLERRRGST